MKGEDGGREEKGKKKREKKEEGTIKLSEERGRK
jgi:hypothetical protein